MNKRVIIFEKRDVYGITKYYPTEAYAQGFEMLTGQKTLTPRTKRGLELMGFDVFVEGRAQEALQL